MLGLVGGGLALSRAQSLTIPGAAMLAAGLAAIALIHAWSGFAPVPKFAQLFALYLIWAAVLAIAATQLAATLGLAVLVRMLATAILVGAVVMAALALLQPWLPPLGWIWLPPARGGTLAQTNHFTTYLWLGLASAMYLRTKKLLSPRLFFAATALLTIAAALAGQRSSIAYLLALGGIAFLLFRRSISGAQPPLRSVLFVLVAFVIAQPLAPLMSPIYMAEAVPPPALNVIQKSEGPSIRLHLLKLGMKGVADAPLLGHGIGSFPGLAFRYAEIGPDHSRFGPAEHSHNLLVQLSVELGIPIALLTALAAVAWLKRLPGRAELPELFWAASVFAVIGLHSLIEYPLWHAYFLGPLALVAGAFGRGPVLAMRNRVAMAIALGVMAWGTLLLIQVGRDNRLIELALTAGQQPSSLSVAKETLLAVPRKSLLWPWLNAVACQSMDPATVRLVDGVSVCHEAMPIIPTVAGLRTAYLLWRSGDLQEAGKLLKRIQYSSSNAPSEIHMLATHLGDHGTHFEIWATSGNTSKPPR